MTKIGGKELVILVGFLGLGAIVSPYVVELLNGGVSGKEDGTVEPSPQEMEREFIESELERAINANGEGGTNETQGEEELPVDRIGRTYSMSDEEGNVTFLCGWMGDKYYQWASPDRFFVYVGVWGDEDARVMVFDPNGVQLPDRAPVDGPVYKGDGDGTVFCVEK